MPEDKDFLARSFGFLQESIRKSGPAAAASYTLIGAIILLGGVGYAVDDWRGTSPWFLLGGLLLGLIVGFYDLAKTVFGRREWTVKPVLWLASASVVSAAMLGVRFGREVWIGMFAPSSSSVSRGC